MVQLDLFDEAKRIVEAGPEEVARWCKLYLKEHQRRIDECNELVTKCNQLEKTLEKTKETLFEEEDRIKSFIENKRELLKKIEQLEKENKKLIGVLNLNREIQENK